jgi:hypothetical protein
VRHDLFLNNRTRKPIDWVFCIIGAAFCRAASGLHVGIRVPLTDQLPKSYFLDHLDKLDVFSKWVVVPRIAAGSQLKKSDQAMQDLRWLIKERNRLVHFKSQYVKPEQIESYKDLDAERAIRTVKAAVLALKTVDPKANETWLQYEGVWFPSRRLG